jgi:hypothetical protein
MSTPKAGVAYSFTVSLFDVANPGRIKTTPTLAAGDFKVSVNGGALANLATLPSETPAGSGLVVVSLAAGEVGTKTVVRWSDPDFEWGDGSYFFDAPAATIEDVSTLTAAGVRTAVGLASANLDTQLSTIAGYVDTEVAAIKAKTDNLPSDPADASDIAASFSSVTTTLATIAGYIDTEVAAIKAKTDNLPASPAATGDAMTLTAGERNAIALALMVLSSTAWEGSAPAKSLGTAIMKAVHKTLDNHGTLEIYRADGTTLHATQSETADATAAALVGLGGAT